MSIFTGILFIILIYSQLIVQDEDSVLYSAKKAQIDCCFFNSIKTDNGQLWKTCNWIHWIRDVDSEGLCCFAYNCHVREAAGFGKYFKDFLTTLLVYVIAVTFNCFSLRTHTFSRQFDVVGGCKYHDTHEPSPPLLRRGSQSETWIRAEVNSEYIVIQTMWQSLRI